MLCRSLLHGYSSVQNCLSLLDQWLIVFTVFNTYSDSFQWIAGNLTGEGSKQRQELIRSASESILTQSFCSLLLKRRYRCVFYCFLARFLQPQSKRRKKDWVLCLKLIFVTFLQQPWTARAWRNWKGNKKNSFFHWAAMKLVDFLPWCWMWASTFRAGV